MTSAVNRYYDPATDQFLSVDPMVDLTGQPYVFTNDNPRNAKDPLGLCWVCNVFHSVVKAVIAFRKFNQRWTGQNKPQNSANALSLRPGSSASQARAELQRSGVKVPSDYSAKPVRSGNGWIFRPPGSTNNDNAIKAMDSKQDPRYSDGYYRIYNAKGIPTTEEGVPLGNAGVGQPETHFPFMPDE